MLSTTFLRSRGTRLIVAIITTFLLALAAQASPAFAQDETLTVTKTGMGTVTSEPAGINCGSDCTEPYPSSTEEICNTHGACNTVTTYESVTLTAAPDAGWAFQSWSGGCSGTATTCTVTVNEANETVHVTFNRISPPNDDFAAAQLISGATTSVPGTTKDATRETGEPDHSSDSWSSDHTVWYRWTAPHTGQWEMYTCTAAIDSILTVYTGNELNALSRVAENNNGCSSGFGSKVSFRATSGTTYRIVVGDAGGAMQNTFTLALASIPAPSNDNFANAELISGASASVDGTNVSATRESGDPSWSGAWNVERSVWYRWTAPYSGSATLDTCTADYDSLLNVSISRWWGLEWIAEANNGCESGFGSKLTFNAQNGQTYHIAVDGCCGAPQGTFTHKLNLVDNVDPETTIHTPQEDEWVTSNTSVTFTFDATEPDSTFECRVYGSGQTAPAFGACSAAGLHTQGDLNSGTYTFDVRATDPRGNKDESPATRTWTVDTEPPGDGTVVINNGAALTNNSAVNLTLSATDPSPSSGVTKMRFSNDGVTWSAWENYATSKSWNLASSAGIKTVHVQFRDAAGNTSTSPATDSIKLDTTAPTATGKPTGTRVSPTANVIATFSEAMNEASVERTNASGLPTTFTLKKKGTTKTLAATVVYSEPTATTFKAVLNPSRNLRAGTTYLATVSSAATDLAGNPLVKKTWKFTVK